MIDVFIIWILMAFLCICFYMLMTLNSESKSKLSDLKSILNIEFDMKDFGNARKNLGMEIEGKTS